MIKMFLVDDEPIICQGLRYTIPWDEHGIEIVGEAHDGQEAFIKITELGDVDVVLTDVVMPVMDGLKLSENLSIKANPPKIIMISGHDEFEYAKQAMRVGVRDYLLKPVNIEELMNTLKKLLAEIAAEVKDSDNLFRSQLKDQIISQIYWSPKINKENLRDLTIYPIISSYKDYYWRTRGYSEEELKAFEEDWIAQLDCFCEELDAFSFFLESNVVMTCIYNCKKKLNPVQLEERLINFNKDFEQYFVLANKWCKVIDIASYYKNLLNILRLAYVSGNQVSFMRNINVEKERQFCSKAIEEKIIKAFFFKNNEQMLEHINHLFESLEHSKVTLTGSFKQCKAIQKNIINDLERLNVIENIEENIKIFNHDESLVHIYNSYDQLHHLFQNELLSMQEVVMNNKSSHNWMIERAIHYIDEFFTNDIKATEVADYIKISPNYFSVLFKEQTGMKFNEYLNKCRVDRAKLLLKETSDKVSNIAQQVGYQEYKYFVQVFKKFTNLTPTDYRNLLPK